MVMVRVAIGHYQFSACQIGDTMILSLIALEFKQTNSKKN